MLSYAPIHDPTPTTQFNNPTFEFTTTANTTIATLSHSNNQSSNQYNHTDYESLTQESFESFLEQAALITNYVIFAEVLNNTISQNTRIKVFDVEHAYYINRSDAGILYVFNNHITHNLVLYYFGIRDNYDG